MEDYCDAAQRTLKVWIRLVMKASHRIYTVHRGKGSFCGNGTDQNFLIETGLSKKTKTGDNFAEYEATKISLPFGYKREALRELKWSQAFSVRFSCHRQMWKWRVCTFPSSNINLFYCLLCFWWHRKKTTDLWACSGIEKERKELTKHDVTLNSRDEYFA